MKKIKFMKTIENIYHNNLGSSYHIINGHSDETHLALEINQISFFVNEKELKEFITSTIKIIGYHKDCTCSKELKNKMVIYQSKQTEIRMKLSYNQLLELKDLLKGTDFKLSMDVILNKYKLN